MPAPKGSRPNLAVGHGVRFETPIVRQIKAMAEGEHVSYSEMARVLVDEAILARLSRPGELGRATLREAVLHAIEYRGVVLSQPKEVFQELWNKTMQDTGEDDDGDGQE